MNTIIVIKVEVIIRLEPEVDPTWHGVLHVWLVLHVGQSGPGGFSRKK